MTSAPLVESQVAPPIALREQVVEFLLVGGATPLMFVVSWLLRESLGLDAADLVVGFTFFHAAYIENDPHFSVTYLLFYEDFKERAFGSAFSRSLRVRYLLAGLLIPAGLALWALTSLASGSAEQLGMLLQLMFVLVGWHYVKQGFGVMMVLSARRGLRFSTTERRIILVHCFAGWAYSWANPHQDARLDEVKGVIYTGVARPYLFEMVALAVLAASTIALVAMLVRKRQREGPLPIFTPLTALLCSIWIWLIYSAADPLVRYMTPALHSLQYLYFVWLLKRNEAKSREVAPFFEAPPRERLAVLALTALALGWFLFHGAEALDDAPFRAATGSRLGPTPYFAALYAFVNLHHYFMDNVIWRRENPRTRHLTETA
jgi:hypothetical protein